MFLSILVFLAVLSILIFIHELGHFLLAKKAGIWVKEFGIGYPPKIWSFKKGNTVYSLNWIPFGGFVSLFGQELGEKETFTKAERKKAFFSQGKIARASVLMAGITGNLLLGLTCFSLVYFKTGIPEPLNYIKIVEVIPGSPAEQVGLTADDQILAVNGVKITSTEDFIKQAENYKGTKVSLDTSRGSAQLLARENPPSGQGRFGVVITDSSMVFYPFYKMIPLSIKWGIKESISWGTLIFKGIITSVQQIFKGIAPQMTGPVGIFQLTNAAAKEGILTLIQFTGILSINLGVLNAMPFPALDGGHLVLVFIGDFFSPNKRKKVERVINMAGLTFLISLMILVTMQDILRIVKSFPIFSFLK